MPAASRLLAFHDRFWVQEGADSEEQIEAREKKLGLRFPAVLRAAYANTSLREGAQLHLLTLDGVDRRGINTPSSEFVWFATDQQSCWAYGLRLKDIDLPDPPVYSDEGGEPREETCTLSQFLEHFWVVNRPYVAPWVCFDDPMDLSDWLSFRNPWVEEGAFWLKDGFVHETNTFQTGARSRSEMERLFSEYGDPEFDEVVWEDPA